MRLVLSMIVVTDLCWYAHPCVMILISCVKICYNVVSDTMRELGPRNSIRSMSSETSVAHACYVLITSRGTASSPAVVVPVDMLAL